MTAFVECYNQGWIYRGKRVMNWCPTCQTVVSDLEVEHRELAANAPLDGADSDLAGAPPDRNVELRLRPPFTLRHLVGE